MAGIGMKWWDLRLMGVVLVGFLLVAQILVMAEVKLIQEFSRYHQTQEVVESDFLVQALNFWWQKGQLDYDRIWPVSKFSITFLFVQCLGDFIFFCLVCLKMCCFSTWKMQKKEQTIVLICFAFC